MRWLFVLALSACAQTERIVEVKVPVEIARTPPVELIECTATLTPPLFDPPPEGKGALLPPEQIPIFQAFVATLYGCDAGWRAWATQP